MTSAINQPFAMIETTRELSQLVQQKEIALFRYDKIQKCLIDKHNQTSDNIVDPDIVKKLYEHLDNQELQDSEIEATIDVLCEYDALYESIMEINSIDIQIQNIKKVIDKYNENQGMCPVHNNCYNHPESTPIYFVLFCKACIAEMQDDAKSWSSYESDTKTTESWSSYESCDSFS